MSYRESPGRRAARLEQLTRGYGNARGRVSDSEAGKALREAWWLLHSPQLDLPGPLDARGRDLGDLNDSKELPTSHRP
jgi:hypothetical protein